MTSHLHLLHLDSHDTMIVLNDVKIVDLGLQCMVISSGLGEVLGPAGLSWRNLRERVAASQDVSRGNPIDPPTMSLPLLPCITLCTCTCYLYSYLVLLSLGFILAQLLLLH